MNFKKWFRKKLDHLKLRYALSSPERFVRYLRNKGIRIGKNPIMTREVRTLQIDMSRPSLIEIGDNVRINMNLTLMTHDFASCVFRNKYHEFIASSGKIKIGNNVYFGRNCTVLKGVTIGDNCVIGFGSLVTKSIPENSVAAGVPAKVICSLDDYYAKRQVRTVEEAFEYARSIKLVYHRQPVIEDFWEEFPLFVDGADVDRYPQLPIRRQLDSAYDIWCKNHKAPFRSFQDFLTAAGVEEE